jgi:hypothetical protein
MQGISDLWSYLAMPAGVVICFGPAILVWLLTEWHDEPQDEIRQAHPTRAD